MGKKIDLDDALVYACGDKDVSAEVVKFLLIEGANPNSCRVYPNYQEDGKDWVETALMRAAKHGEMAKMEYLVRFGADVSKEDGYGSKAEDYARTEGHESACEWLKKAEDKQKEQKARTIGNQVRNFDLDR